MKLPQVKEKKDFFIIIIITTGGYMFLGNIQFAANSHQATFVTAVTV